MKTKLLYILLITLLISNMILLFMLINKPKFHKPPHRFLFEELNLNEKQLRDVTICKDEHHQKMKKIDREIKQLKERFFKSISNNANTVNSDSIADLIGINASNKDKEVLSYFKKIRSICDEKQKNKLDKIILKALPKKPKMPSRRN